MLPSTTVPALGRAVAIALAAQVGLASTAAVAGEQGGAQQFHAEPARTGKERLGGKSSDEQRVDNCNVPLELRGQTPRPDDCGDGVSVAGARPGDIPRVVFFGFELINTSLEQASPLEGGRLQMLDDLFRERLGASGRFKIVPIPPEMQKQIADGPAIRNCNGCQRDFARKVGADWAAWGTVQKVSSLILNINLFIEDSRTGKPNFLKSVDIRGNTDESWRHGLEFMLRHYVFATPWWEAR